MPNRRDVNCFPPDEKPPLVAECFWRVQFNEVDFWRIVWHGWYLKYFEQGRNEWGRKFGLSYLDMIKDGFAMMTVRVHIDHYYPLHYDELIRIKTIGHWTEAAKMNMSYEIYAPNGMLSAQGYTVQLFTDLSGKIMLLRPEFAEEFFQKKWEDLNSFLIVNP